MMKELLLSKFRRMSLSWDTSRFKIWYSCCQADLHNDYQIMLNKSHKWSKIGIPATVLFSSAHTINMVILGSKTRSEDYEHRNTQLFNYWDSSQSKVIYGVLELMMGCTYSAMMMTSVDAFNCVFYDLLKAGKPWGHLSSSH